MGRYEVQGSVGAAGGLVSMAQHAPTRVGLSTLLPLQNVEGHEASTPPAAYLASMLGSHGEGTLRTGRGPLVLGTGALRHVHVWQRTLRAVHSPANMC